MVLSLLFEDAAGSVAVVALDYGFILDKWGWTGWLNTCIALLLLVAFVDTRIASLRVALIVLVPFLIVSCGMA